MTSPLTVPYPTNPKEANDLISKMGGRGHSEQVLVWRISEFKRMGFMDAMAEFLGGTAIDLHEMEDRLLKRGCDHTTAVDILLGTCFLGDDPTWHWENPDDTSKKAS